MATLRACPSVKWSCSARKSWISPPFSSSCTVDGRTKGVSFGRVCASARGCHRGLPAQGKRPKGSPEPLCTRRCTDGEDASGRRPRPPCPRRCFGIPRRCQDLSPWSSEQTGRDPGGRQGRLPIRCRRNPGPEMRSGGRSSPRQAKESSDGALAVTWPSMRIFL